MPTRKSPSVAVKIAATAQDFLECQAIRATVFMGEQQCPYEEEFDGNDYCALHVLGHVNGAPAATIRMRFFADLVKLERMAVLPQWRKTTVKQQLVFLAFEIARRKGYRRCYAHVEKRLLPFWGRFGFEVFPRNTTLKFSDHEYVEIVRDLEPHPETLSLNSDPMVLNRLEGSWDAPGVLDRSTTRPATNPC
jgi:predicted GNAT family N-acyltransferase